MYITHDNNIILLDECLSIQLESTPSFYNVVFLLKQGQGVVEWEYKTKEEAIKVILSIIDVYLKEKLINYL